MLEFLNVGISLCEISDVFSASDPRFTKLECQLDGCYRWTVGVISGHFLPFKKLINCFLSPIGSWILTWKYLFVSSPITISSSSSHDTDLSEEMDNPSCDCYNVVPISEESTSTPQCPTAATIHYLAIDWHPESLATSLSVGYFTLTCNVDETAPHSM